MAAQEQRQENLYDTTSADLLARVLRSLHATAQMVGALTLPAAATERDRLVDDGRLQTWRLPSGHKLYGLPPDGGAGCPAPTPVQRSTRVHPSDGEIARAMHEVLAETFDDPSHDNTGLSASALEQGVQRLLGPLALRRDLDRVLQNAIEDQTLSTLPAGALGHARYAPNGAQPGDHAHQRLRGTRGEEHLGIITANPAGDGWTRRCHICGELMDWFRHFCAALQYVWHMLQCERHRQGQNYALLQPGQVIPGPARVARATLAAINALDTEDNVATQADLVNITEHTHTALGNVYSAQVGTALVYLLDDRAIAATVIHNGRQLYAPTTSAVDGGGASRRSPGRAPRKSAVGDPSTCPTCRLALHMCICQHHRPRSRSPPPPSSATDPRGSANHASRAPASSAGAPTLRSHGTQSRDSGRSAPTVRSIHNSTVMATQVVNATASSGTLQHGHAALTSVTICSSMCISITAMLILIMTLRVALCTHGLDSAPRNRTPEERIKSSLRRPDKATRTGRGRQPPEPRTSNVGSPGPAKRVKLSELTLPNPTAGGHHPSLAPPPWAPFGNQDSDGESEWSDTWIDDFGPRGPPRIRLTYAPEVLSGVNSDCDEIVESLSDEEIASLELPALELHLVWAMLEIRTSAKSFFTVPVRLSPYDTLEENTVCMFHATVRDLCVCTTASPPTIRIDRVVYTLFRPPIGQEDVQGLYLTLPLERGADSLGDLPDADFRPADYILGSRDAAASITNEALLTAAGIRSDDMTAWLQRHTSPSGRFPVWLLAAVCHLKYHWQAPIIDMMPQTVPGDPEPRPPPRHIYG